MPLSFAAEKYALGRDLMAVSHGSLQDRLRRAFVHHIASLIGERDLPEGLREEHEALLERVSRGGGDGDGPIAATCARMSDQDASEVAAEVLYLEYRIRSLYQAPPWHYVGRATAVIRLPASPNELHPDAGERPPTRN